MKDHKRSWFFLCYFFERPGERKGETQSDKWLKNIQFLPQQPVHSPGRQLMRLPVHVPPQVPFSLTVLVPGHAPAEVSVDPVVPVFGPDPGVFSRELLLSLKKNQPGKNPPVLL